MEVITMSNQQTNNNIEAIISRISFNIVKEIKESSNKKKYKNLIDKALGVLVNNGVDAYSVYIISQKDRDVEKIFLDTLQDIFELIKINEEYKSNNKKNNREEYFQKISEDLHKLLFLKQLLEKTLIYARYHAKALEGGENE